MTTYQYQLNRAPNVQKLNADVLSSSMVFKSLESCKWNGATGILELQFTAEISAGDKIILDAIVEGMPRGHAVIALSSSAGNRWQQHYGYASFGSELQIVPARIETSNVLANGLSSLLIDEITASGFRYSASTTGSGDNLGAIELSFDWEAKA
jgi:hypothetical protein